MDGPEVEARALWATARLAELEARLDEKERALEKSRSVALELGDQLAELRGELAEREYERKRGVKSREEELLGLLEVERQRTQALSRQLEEGSPGRRSFQNNTADVVTGGSVGGSTPVSPSQSRPLSTPRPQQR